MTAAHYDTVIIGAGLSGIGAACHIASEFPHRTMAILERREKMGGTWDLFRYPGIRSDSDMASFGFNFKPWYSDQVLAKGSTSATTSSKPRGSSTWKTRCSSA